MPIWLHVPAAKRPVKVPTTQPVTTSAIRPMVTITSTASSQKAARRMSNGGRGAGKGQAGTGFGHAVSSSSTRSANSLTAFTRA